MNILWLSELPSYNKAIYPFTKLVLGLGFGSHLDLTQKT